MPAIDPLRYPIGPFVHDGAVTAADRERWLGELAELPSRYRRTLAGSTDARLDVAYRPGGWTLRQVVHHVPDSHVNAYVRFKLALTEDAPRVRTYDEAAWARLPDVRGVPVGAALDLLDAVHARWVALLRMLSEAAWSRVYVHPEAGAIPLDRALGQYAWHGRHHLAHLELVLGPAAPSGR